MYAWIPFWPLEGNTLKDIFEKLDRAYTCTWKGTCERWDGCLESPCMPHTGITIPSEPCTLFDDRKPRQFVDTQVRSHPSPYLSQYYFSSRPLVGAKKLCSWLAGKSNFKFKIWKSTDLMRPSVFPKKNFLESLHPFVSLKKYNFSLFLRMLYSYTIKHDHSHPVSFSNIHPKLSPTCPIP